MLSWLSFHRTEAKDRVLRFGPSAVSPLLPSALAMTVRQIPLDAHATVVGVLRQAAEINGDVEAYVEPARSVNGSTTPRQSMTFEQWDRAADGVAGWLSDHGVGHGDVVALVLPSSIDYAIVYAAALRLGAISSGVNPRLGKGELASIFSRSRPLATVIDHELGVELPPWAGTVLRRADIAAASQGPPPETWPTIDQHDPVAVVWTSGTTGQPKGAVFDHANLRAVAAGIDVLSQPGDRRLSPLPFAHVGYMTRGWDEIAHGVTTVITPTPWRASDALAILETEKISVAQGVPTQWALVLALPEIASTDFSSLRIAGTGAARMSAEQVAELRQRLGVPVVVRYTSTETSLGTGTRPDDPDEVVAITVGRPVPGVELELVGDDGASVPIDSVGRVRIRSGATMRGYWRDVDGDDDEGPAAEGAYGWERYVDTALTQTVRDEEGWISTGDFGALDGSGNLRLVGRANDLYIRGGYNVYPAEVEEVLASHGAIEQAAVVGTADDVLGEVGVAFIVVSAGEDPPSLSEVKALCSRALADYKSPDLRRGR